MSKTYNKLTKADIESIRAQIQDSGARIHLVYTSAQCKARLWHCDGHTLASAGGSGYDKGSSALVDALGNIWPEALEAASLAYFGEPGRSLYGGIGLDTVVNALNYAGFEVDRHEYKDGTLFLISTIEQADKTRAERRAHIAQRTQDHVESLARKVGA